MASEEERAAILAEYKASLVAGMDDDDDIDDDDDDEADFDPDAAVSDEDEDDDAGGEPDYVVLNGSIHLNEEGRIIFSGTWCMKSEVDADNNDNGEDSCSHPNKLKKHPKFKLKSQDVCYTASFGDNANINLNNGNKKLFDIRYPTLTKFPEKVTNDGDDDNVNRSREEIMDLPARRIMIFDGFFFEKSPELAAAAASTTFTPNEEKGEMNVQSPRKIKERDVEIFISMEEEDDEEDDGVIDDKKTKKKKTTTTYRIAGRGENEYGQFVLDGSYTPPMEEAVGKDDGREAGKDNGENHHHHHHHHKHRGKTATVICNKTYGVGISAKETRASKRGSGGDGGRAKRKVRADDDSFDEDFDDEERADYTELIELSEDANLSVEELRKKYYGGGGIDGNDDDEVDEDDDGGGKMAATKRPRLDDEAESDDEECGF